MSRNYLTYTPPMIAASRGKGRPSQNKVRQYMPPDCVRISAIARRTAIPRNAFLRALDRGELSYEYDHNGSRVLVDNHRLHRFCDDYYNDSLTQVRRRLKEQYEARAHFISSLYAEGVSAVALAKIMKCDRATIRNYVYAAGGHYRTRSEAAKLREAAKRKKRAVNNFAESRKTEPKVLTIIS